VASSIRTTLEAGYRLPRRTRTHTSLFARPYLNLPSADDVPRAYREQVEDTKTTFGIETSLTLPTGSSIKTYVKNLPAVESELTKLFGRIVIREWLEDGERLKAALERDRDALEAFMRANLLIPVGLGLIRPKVKSILGLSLKEIVRASPSLVIPSERASDTTERVTFTASVTVREQVETSAVTFPAAPTTLRVGEQVPQGVVWASFPLRTEISEVDVDMTIDGEADAHIVAGQCRELTYVSVKSSEPPPVF
jgi:hypothetical protein